MMNKWRSLFGTGCLMAVLVLFGAEAAFAQATPVTDLAAAARSHETIRLTWTNDNANLDKFSLRYQQNTPADATAVAASDFDTTMTINRMDIKKHSSTEYSYTVDGLKPGMDYIFGLTALPIGDGQDQDGAEDFDTATTHTADAPDDVMNLMLTAGDAMIMAMWDMATDNGSPVTGYSVEYREKGESAWMEARDGTMGMDTSTKWTLSNLMNDTMYEVRVQACSYDMCGDWTDEEAKPMAGAMPTPALPLFGAFALGAGLLAAGRARLRRREQRQLTR